MRTSMTLIRCGAVMVSLLALGACTPTPTPSATATSAQPSTTASASPIATASAAPSASAATMTVTVYFGNSIQNPNAADCHLVFPVARTVPASPDKLTAAMKELLGGPTAAEKSQGYRSFFSPATANSLIKAKVVGTTVYVDLIDLRTVIPNASTSCGSAEFLGELGMTARTAAQTSPVRYAINGQPKPFWEWLQMGCDASNDNCDPAPFA